MTEVDKQDGVFKPLPNPLNFPFFGLRFIRLRYIVLGVLVWNAAFLLIRGVGVSLPLDQSPERLISQGLICVAFAACCLAVLFIPSIEVAVLAKPEGRRLLRRDLWLVAVLLLFLAVAAFWSAVRVLSA